MSGKAGRLLELQAGGFPVPSFVVSPPSLREAVSRLGFPLAVRSSASREDGREASFAGLFPSYLQLHSLDGVQAAVRACRESIDTPAIAAYCRRHGIDREALRMDVIVQRMIAPEVAGVAFTVNPATGAEEVVVEACPGLADALLAGRVAPLPDTHPLLQRHRPAIEATARRIQRHFGAPQDVEFAVAGGIVHVLQARPITRIGWDPAVGEWTNADFRDGGVSARVCSPLMWSLYDLVWESTLKGCLRELRLLDGDFQAGRLFYGRPYWNLGAVKRCLRTLPGYIEREFDADLSVQITYDGDGERTPVTARSILQALPTIIAIAGFLRRQEARARALLMAGIDDVERRYATPHPDPESALRALVYGDYVAIESSYFRTIFAASLAKLDLKRACPDADYPALVAGLPPLRHMAPGQALREMATRGEQDVAVILKQFRYLTRDGVDIMAPRWDEDRAFVEALLRRPPAPIDRNHRQWHQAARRAALARLPAWRRSAFRRKLDRVRSFVWLREELRDFSSRIYYLIRRLTLDIGRRRGLGEDVFFMTPPQLLADDRSEIARHRETFESYRNFQAPNEIGHRYRRLGNGVPVAGGFRGVGASPGTAHGPAWLAHTAADAVAVDAGAVLVCPYTDPGWTPLLDRVAGVVTETGGLLSHAAVICREYGIPAVLGVPDALARIQAGAALVVRGDEGVVEPVD